MDVPRPFVSEGFEDADARRVQVVVGGEMLTSAQGALEQYGRREQLEVEVAVAR